jgi:neopullulanase
MLPRPFAAHRAAHILAAFAACLSALVAHRSAAQGAGGSAMSRAPVVEKVDPPDWWAGYSIDPVRLLIRGRNLTGARLQCARVACANVKVNAAGTYAFADVTIPRRLAAGSYPLTLRTAAGSAPVPFSVSAPLPAAGRFQGFDANDVIYLVMPDRFANGDPSNDEPAGAPGMVDRSNPRRYHGGDLAGVRARLPYLRSLGVTAIWLNPVYDNTTRRDTVGAGARRPATPYHGYHAVDYYGVEEHFGDLAEVRRLVDAAHAQGIKVLLDMVANHTGPDHPWAHDPPTPTWFHGTVASHLANTFQGWTVADPYSPPAMRRATLDGWFVNVLPDLNQDDPEVARYLIQNTLWWVGATGIDGIRQDTWQFVPRRFWRDWMTAINRQYPALRVVGEVLEGDPALNAFHQGGRVGFDGVDPKVQSMFDFPVYFTLRDAFARGRPLRPVALMVARDHLYPDPAALVTLLGSHDERRFMSEEGATIDGLKLAYTFLLTARGIPLLYYGDEIAMPGDRDPDNRRDFPGGFAGDARDAFDAAGRTPEQQAVWSHVQRLLRLRAERADLRRGATEHLQVGEQTYVYRRGRTVVALNNDTKPAEVRLPAMELPADALGLCPAPRRDAGGLTLTIPARTGCVF